MDYCSVKMMEDVVVLSKLKFSPGGTGKELIIANQLYMICTQNARISDKKDLDRKSRVAEP
ncbi:MAG: hypothetical protein KDC45_05155 [Bacteroidetes bacterium]|nr:hypothetical protein [Bacteroidota bacterium]